MWYYFAYGSNLHRLQMKKRCPNCHYIKKIILNDYRMTFRSKYGAADIEKKKGSKVYGALYVISKTSNQLLRVLLTILYQLVSIIFLIIHHITIMN